MPKGKLKAIFDEDTKSFWDTFSVTVPETGLTLNTSNPMDELKHKLLLADPLIANNKSELSLKPNVEYVISSDKDEAEIENVKRSIIGKAYSEFYKLSKNKIVDVLYMFGKDAGDLDPDIAESRLGSIVENSPQAFLNVISDSLFSDKVWFKKLIKAGIVKKHGTGTGTSQPLYFNDVMLGNSLEEAIAYVKSSENQNIYMGLKKALKA